MKIKVIDISKDMMERSKIRFYSKSKCQYLRQQKTYGQKNKITKMNT